MAVQAPALDKVGYVGGGSALCDAGIGTRVQDRAPLRKADGRDDFIGALVAARDVEGLQGRGTQAPTVDPVGGRGIIVKKLSAATTTTTRRRRRRDTTICL